MTVFHANPVKRGLGFLLASFQADILPGDEFIIDPTLPEWNGLRLCFAINDEACQVGDGHWRIDFPGQTTTLRLERLHALRLDEAPQPVRQVITYKLGEVEFTVSVLFDYRPRFEAHFNWVSRDHTPEAIQPVNQFPRMHLEWWGKPSSLPTIPGV